MKVSFNELQGLSRKAFIGIGFDEGHADLLKFDQNNATLQEIAATQCR